MTSTSTFFPLQSSTVLTVHRWHTASLPDKATTAGVTHVTTAFAESTLFNWGGQYTPFMPLDQVRALFDEGVQVCMAVGGWGDNAGFTSALATEETRATFATNLANEINRLGYDCVGMLTLADAC